MGQSLGHLEPVNLFTRDNVDDVMGIWYEIAVIRNEFESKCLGAIAAYSGWKSKVQINETLKAKQNELGKDSAKYAEWFRNWRDNEMNSFMVTNYCVYKSLDKKLTDWACQIGKATLVKQNNNEMKARFVVQFSKFLPFDIIARAGGNFQIVDLHVDKTNSLDSYLVIFGGQDRFFWILSRSPTFSTTSTFDSLKQKYKPWVDKSEIHDPSIYDTFKQWSENQCLQNPAKREHN